MTSSAEDEPLQPFGRNFFTGSTDLSRIGGGEIGGKARGLVLAREIVRDLDPALTSLIEVGIPRMAVIGTDMFDAFVERNGIDESDLRDRPDGRIAHAIQKGELPVEMLGDLRAIMEESRMPLAVRSSSLLEDALYRPFAGVYETKMIPNNDPAADARFRKLTEAIKFVYASTFLSGARSYLEATGQGVRDEKMAVIIQEVVGLRHDDRFYPEVSGVGRSWNYYPVAGARAGDGVINLALGLGKTIVDGGICWSYSPGQPKVPPPFPTVRDLLAGTQVRFWAVNMGRPPAYDPIAETEYLVEGTLEDADRDGVLPLLASTYDGAADRLSPGTGAEGARAITFAPLLVLRELPLNDLLQGLLRACERTVGAAVEIEFAMTIAEGFPPRARLGLLQVRPMVVSEDQVEIDDADLASPLLVAASARSMGNGVEDGIADVVFVRPETFEARHTPAIAGQIERLNRTLVAARRPYLLIGFGRWGSSDPWLGIPVQWGQISGARAIVEATLPQMNVEASQGAHFFHNISSFRISYLTVHHEAKPGIDWGWLNAQDTIAETDHVRHVRLRSPLVVKVDGRTGRGGVWRRS